MRYKIQKKKSFIKLPDSDNERYVIASNRKQHLLCDENSPCDIPRWRALACNRIEMCKVQVQIIIEKLCNYRYYLRAAMADRSAG